jgi:hypothetical protein
MLKTFHNAPHPLVVCCLADYGLHWGVVQNRLVERLCRHHEERGAFEKRSCFSTIRVMKLHWTL